MPAIGNHYIATLRGHDSIHGQALQNAFCYQAVSGSPTAALLGDILNAVLLPLLTTITSVNTIYDDIYIVNLEDPADFATEIIGTDGDVTGDAMPPFVSFTYEYIRASRAVNNGRKAFGLVPESSVANGNIVGGVSAAVEAVADYLAEDTSDLGSTATFSPRIWRRPGTYASGVVAAPGAFYSIADVRFVGISTQNTRKIGRGI